MAERTSEKILEEAVQLCFDNAEQFIKDAEVLVDNRSYGHAFALVVLGEEETVKAMMYSLFSEGLLPEHYELYLKKRLDSHLHKQAWAGALTFAYRMIGLAQSLWKSSREQEGSTTRRKFEEMTSELKVITKGDLERFKTLQEDKEKGLYVDLDFERKELSSPKSLGKDEVERYLSQAKLRFEFAKSTVRSISHLSPSEKEIGKAQIKEAVRLAMQEH